MDPQVKWLQGDVAVVTGSAQGIGREIALTIARQGAIVFAADVNDAKNEETVALIETEGFTVHAVHLDIAESSAVKDCFRQINELTGKINIFVNNAALIGFSPLETCSDQEWDAVMRVDLHGYFYCLREIYPYLKASGGGRIVQMSSSSAKSGSSYGGAHYTAAKGAIISLSKYAARRWAKDNIRVNTVCPGITNTPLGNHPGAPRDLNDFVKDIPLGRVAEPEDIAAAVLFMVSEGSRYITGITLDVNGGRYVYGN